MMQNKSIIFTLPHVPYNQQLSCCLSIMRKQHHELIPLRRQTKSYISFNHRLMQQIEQLKEKYQKSQEELQRAKKEIEQLKQEIEKLTKTNNRYQIALFDHGNFKHQENEDKKKKGGQPNHPDTNREQSEDYHSFQRQRLFAKTCGRCNHPLPRVKAIKQKILLDIIIHPQIVKMIIESERQWCAPCKREVNAKDKRTLPFTEYGMNTFMMVMILRFKCHASLSNIATVITISHGLSLSKSHVSNLLSQAKTYLFSRYQQLVDAVRKGEVMYNDETGWIVRGENAWMWIMTNEQTTVYIAAESRGRGIMEDMYENSEALSMHDGLASYLKSIPQDKHLYCWAHFLRFCFEETVGEKNNSQSVSIRDKLVTLYHLKKEHADYSLKKLEFILIAKLNEILQIQSSNSSIKAIQKRLRVQKEGLVRALLYTPDGTNNLAERELRPMVINKKISYGSDTFYGMETSAILGSIIQTLVKIDEPLILHLRQYLQEGVQEKHQQYFHQAYYDSS